MFMSGDEHIKHLHCTIFNLNFDITIIFLIRCLWGYFKFQSELHQSYYYIRVTSETHQSRRVTAVLYCSYYCVTYYFSSLVRQ